MVGKPSQGIEDHLKALIICTSGLTQSFWEGPFTCKDCLIKFPSQKLPWSPRQNNGAQW